MPSFRRWIRLPWRSRTRIRRDIEQEFAFHLDMRVAELIARGMTPEEARAEAVRRFGDVTDAREYCRTMDERSTTEQQRRDWIAELEADLRFALRQMRRSPAFTGLAVLTLALGIGATTAIFSVVNHLLLDPIPVPGGDRIVTLNRSNLEGNLYVTPTSKLLDVWRTNVRSLEAVAAFGWKDVMLAGRDEPEEVRAGVISAEISPLLHARPALGRAILSEDTKVGAPKVVVLGYGMWQRRFAGDRRVLGKTLTIDDTSYTIIGVMPRDFAVPFMDAGARQLWLPLEQRVDDGHGAQAIARMQPGVERAQVDRELTAAMRALDTQEPEFKEWKGLALRPQDYLGSGTRDTLLIMLGAVAMVLLIACANIANLLLARAATREREFAIRAALGAGRWRIIRQLLTESTLLALAGGALGIVVAHRALDLIIALRPERLSELDDVRLSSTVLSVSLALTVLTGILFGLAPAMFAAARQIGDTLKSATRSASGHRGSRRMRNALVIAEVSLSVLLLVGAGLLVRTLVKMQRADIGFEAAGLTSASIRLPDRYATQAAREPVFDELLQRVQAIPGVVEATYAMGVPPRTGVTFGQLEIEGRSLGNDERVTALWSQFAAPEYFRLMRLPLVAGRAMSGDSTARELIINEAMAKFYWPGTSAVGRRIRLNPKGEWDTVVGVARDVTIPSTGAKRRPSSDFQMYFPFFSSFESATLIVRTAGAIPDFARRLSREAAAVDASIRVRDVTSVEASLDRELAGPRFNMTLLAVFAGLALVLATIGLYGVIAYSVSQRTREMGIRLALGAGRPAVMRLVMSQGARLTLVGLAAGLLVAGALTRVMASMLYRVSPLDAPTFIAVGVVLALVAVTASYFPARRATRVDPVVALRAE